MGYEMCFFTNTAQCLIIFLVHDQFGSSEMITTGYIPHVYRTCNLEHCRTVFELPTLSVESEENGLSVKMDDYNR